MTKFYTKNKKVRPITPRQHKVGTYQQGIAHLNVPKKLGNKKVIQFTGQPSDKISFAMFEGNFVHQSNNGSLTVRVMRAGRENTDEDRGGTWYENKIHEGQKSSYQEGTLAHVPVGVGGREYHEKTVTLKKPYYIAWNGTEGQIVLDVAKRTLGEDRALTLKRQMTGYKAEKGFAKAETELSQVFSSKGYDGIVFYSTTGPAYPMETFVFKKR